MTKSRILKQKLKCLIQRGAPKAAINATRVAIRKTDMVRNDLLLTDTPSFVCGGAVDAGLSNCDSYLWGPTNNHDMHCYAYGGPNDPCALSYTNDASGNWIEKKPSLCDGDTFYLWDEPDTQEVGYTQAGEDWISYYKRWTEEINYMIGKGVKFTTPLIRSGGDNVIEANLKAFWDACGDCESNIDVVAVNAYCGSWNVPPGTEDGCRGGC